MNVLVVDDDVVQLESLKRGLNNKGYQVLQASSGEEALGFVGNADENKVDLVLTDYIMPGMNGIDLLKRIRDNHGSLPVIIMTAYGEKHVVVDAFRNLCDSFIEKPFTLNQLMEEITRVMK